MKCLLCEIHTHAHAHARMYTHAKLLKFSTAFATDKLFMTPTKFEKIENKAKH